MTIEKQFMIILAACAFGAFGSISVTAQASPAAKKPAATSTTRTSHMSTDPALLQPASLKDKAPDVYAVKFTTTNGEFVITVTRAWAPLGADRFYNLVKHHFFNEAAFFRVVPGFVVQFGISADPQVARAWQNAAIGDDKVTQSNKVGSVTFATAGPNTRTTQLFINLGNNTFLDSQGFSPFGKVTEGMDVVQKIYSGYDEKPDQGQIVAKGKAYLDQNFPKLDSIKSAVIVTGSAKPASANPPKQ